MKISIVTVYNTANCGSFWQAYALGNVLQKEGHEVAFVKRDNSYSSNMFSKRTKAVLSKCVKGRFAGAKLIIERNKKFRKAEKMFRVISRKSDYYEATDCFVYGSDTIWNFETEYFYRHWREYTGKLENGKKKISYAAAAANTTSELFEFHPEIGEAIGNLDSILVRDKSTQMLVKQGTGREAKIVCDPTLLLSKTDYENIIGNQKEIIPDCIVLYYFGKIPKEIVRQICQFAREENLRIVSIGEDRKWCDKAVPYDPFLFISLITNAKYIVTNTFHGTIFSVIFRKNFVSFAGNKRKIYDFLESIGLTCRIATSKDSIKTYFDDMVYSDVVETQIDGIRDFSIRTLKNALEK